MATLPRPPTPRPDRPNPLLLRAAVRLHALYLHHRTTPVYTFVTQLTSIRDTCFQSALREATLLERVTERNWLIAAKSQRDSLRYTVESLISSLKSSCLPEEEPKSTLPSIRDLYLEISAAEEEFKNLEVDTKEQRISVSTDPIRLEGRNLGVFRIDLEWDHAGEADPLTWFRVEAQDPDTPVNNDDVTHPHVDGGRLCTGDATSPITQALRDGRLCDFFNLVRSVLNTYNAGSAYVQLDEWDGRSCADCGHTSRPDDLCYCDRCDQDFCDECIRCCSHCCNAGCRSCLSQSDFSRDWVCPSCSVSCSECDKSGAPEDLEDGLCEGCREELAQQDVDQESESTSSEANEDTPAHACSSSSDDHHDLLHPLQALTHAETNSTHTTSAGAHP